MHAKKTVVLVRRCEIFGVMKNWYSVLVTNFTKSLCPLPCSYPAATTANSRHNSQAQYRVAATLQLPCSYPTQSLPGSYPALSASGYPAPPPQHRSWVATLHRPLQGKPLDLVVFFFRSLRRPSREKSLLQKDQPRLRASKQPFPHSLPCNSPW